MRAQDIAPVIVSGGAVAVGAARLAAAGTGRPAPGALFSADTGVRLLPSARPATA
ncbi:hypothetical protein ACIA6C_23425 [Streptomyces sp. NPDC051578]|uniref:hypothetical protein n=1 Tax=Streptomyces sp. NPDC051578 TaxID=3365662 RepID=UPI00378F8FC7